MITQEVILAIKEKMTQAEQKSGRTVGGVRLMAVSKTRTFDEILVASQLGLSLFGENRVQEAIEKFDKQNLGELHLIGHLQSNKVKKAVSCFDVIESVDSLKLAQKISAAALEVGKVQSIFIEENCSGESAKSGFDSLDTILEHLDELQKLKGVKIKGLMTMAPFTSDEKVLRHSFSRLRNSFEKLKSEGLADLEDLSMGMSGDFEIAIEEGSTLVRIGTALFGARDYGVV